MPRQGQALAKPWLSLGRNVGNTGVFVKPKVSPGSLEHSGTVDSKSLQILKNLKSQIFYTIETPEKYTSIALHVAVR